jgi:hypothetical protein
MSKEMSESTVWDPKRFVTPLTEMIASVPSGSLGCGAVAPGPVTGADARSVGTLPFVERAARGAALARTFRVGPRRNARRDDVHVIA